MSSHHIETRVNPARSDRRKPRLRPPSGIDLISEGRREILLELCRNPGASAVEIGEALFLSSGAIRLHLRGLLADGLVEYVTHRGSVGRPRHIYRLTRLGRSLFPSAAEQVLIGVLDRLQEQDPAAYQRVLNEVESAFSDYPIAEPARETTLQSRIDGLDHAMTEFGHECEARLHGDAPEYRVYNCAIFEVARRNPGICEAERRWLAGLFPETEITLDTWMVNGDLFCRFIGGSNRPEGATMHSSDELSDPPDNP